jgi:hypothetical protein
MIAAKLFGLFENAGMIMVPPYRVAHTPAFEKADQKAEGNLNRQNYRQYRPRDVNGVRNSHEKKCRRTVLARGRLIAALTSKKLRNRYD